MKKYQGHDVQCSYSVSNTDSGFSVTEWEFIHIDHGTRVVATFADRAEADKYISAKFQAVRDEAARSAKGAKKRAEKGKKKRPFDPK